MPLYMDFHDGLEGITIEDIKIAHTADLEVQAKYGVSYKQFWVNSEAGTVFCLVEGPDAQSCAAAHNEAHGNMACNLSEVESGFFELMMATGGQHGLTMDDSGSPDNASRSIVAISLLEVYKKNTLPTNATNGLFNEASKTILRQILEHNGRELNQASAELIGVFNKTDAALNCALSIQKKLLSEEFSSGSSEIIFKISVSTSQPLTNETDEFFEEGLKKAKRLCKISRNKMISVSSFTLKLFKRLKAFETKTSQSLSFFNSPDEEFISALFDVVDEELYKMSFNVESLSRKIGMSRPQVYRKITNLTGISPNNLIRQLRLQSAYEKLKNNDGNIAEIALQVGFSNPSYFSKCFQDNYGYPPSILLR